ncbi:MAG: hypothetical protein M0P57_03455 [Syntrophales bacterium]|nr:hypothetical protein [Syntrophales bacterium]MDY0044256.1 hypothetical protein [Syntrophales bacterium]
MRSVTCFYLIIIMITFAILFSGCEGGYGVTAGTGYPFGHYYDHLGYDNSYIHPFDYMDRGWRVRPPGY